MPKLIKIKGDASFRFFFRKKVNGKSSIVVYAKKEKFKNLLVYDAINKILNKNKILAPRLYTQRYDKNFIEIEDFGNETVFKTLKKKGKNKLSYFNRIIKLLIQIQSIKHRKVKNFKNQNYIIPKYDKKILINEANLFCDWYAKNNLSKLRKKRFCKKFKKIIKDSHDMIYYISMLSTTGGKLKISTKKIINNYRKIKKINPKKNYVIGFGITEKTISRLKKADGLVVGSAICKKITESINRGQNPVINAGNMVKKLKMKLL